MTERPINDLADKIKESLDYLDNYENGLYDDFHNCDEVAKNVSKQVIDDIQTLLGLVFDVWGDHCAK